MLGTGVALLAAVGMLGCGTGAQSNSGAARVGNVMIARAAVEHWAGVTGLGVTVGTLLGRLHGNPGEKALEFLISSQWLLGEAARHGIVVSDRSVELALREKLDSLPGGQAALRSKLAATGRTVDDLKLEIKLELAAAMLRTALIRRAPALTRADVLRYYERNRRSFLTPAERVVDLIENLSTPTAARALAARLGTGSRFARRAQRERVPRQTPAEAAHRRNGRLVRAIFAVPVGREGGPVSFLGRWVILVVRSELPGTPRPLDEVAGTIAARLLAQRRRAIEPAFLASFRRRWRSETKCEAGFIVPKCIDYKGPLKPEDDPLGSSERGASL
jgi:hypothetical protein